MIVRIVLRTSILEVKTYHAKAFSREGGKVFITEYNNVSHEFPTGVGDFEVIDDCTNNSQNHQYGAPSPKL